MSDAYMYICRKEACTCIYMYPNFQDDIVNSLAIEWCVVSGIERMLAWGVVQVHPELSLCASNPACIPGPWTGLVYTMMCRMCIATYLYIHVHVQCHVYYTSLETQ